MEENFFKKRKVAWAFSVFALASGFVFMNTGSITGNAIIENRTLFNPLSLIGILLVFCSIVLAVYTVRKR